MEFFSIKSNLRRHLTSCRKCLAICRMVYPQGFIPIDEVAKGLENHRVTDEDWRQALGPSISSSLAFIDYVGLDIPEPPLGFVSPGHGTKCKQLERVAVAPAFVPPARRTLQISLSNVLDLEHREPSLLHLEVGDDREISFTALKLTLINAAGRYGLLFACWTLFMGKSTTLPVELQLHGATLRRQGWSLPLSLRLHARHLPSRGTTAKATVQLCQSEAATAYGACPGCLGGKCSKSLFVRSFCLSALPSSRLLPFLVQEVSLNILLFSNAIPSFTLHPFGGSRNCLDCSTSRLPISLWFFNNILACPLASLPFLQHGG